MKGDVNLFIKYILYMNNDLIRLLFCKGGVESY